MSTIRTASAAAWEEALAADRPVVLEAKTDPEVPPLPPHITLKQAKAFTSTLLSGDPQGRLGHRADGQGAGCRPAARPALIARCPWGTDGGSEATAASRTMPHGQSRPSRCRAEPSLARRIGWVVAAVGLAAVAAVGAFRLIERRERAATASANREAGRGGARARRRRRDPGVQRARR